MSATIPSGAQETLVDVLEWLCGRILLNRESRLESWNEFQFFWDCLVGKEKHSDEATGKLANLRRVASLVVDITHQEHRAAATFGSSVLDDTEISPSTVALAQWGHDDWKALKTELKGIRDDFIRRDAEELYGNPDDHHLHPIRSQSGLYSDDLELLFKYIRMHDAVSPFRWGVEQLIVAGSRGNAEVVDPPQMEEYCNLIEKMTNNDKVRDALESLLTSRPALRGSRRPPLRLKPLEELAPILAPDSKPFGFSYFVSKVERLLLRWLHDTYGSSKLADLGYAHLGRTEEAREQPSAATSTSGRTGTLPAAAEDDNDTIESFGDSGAENIPPQQANEKTPPSHSPKRTSVAVRKLAMARHKLRENVENTEDPLEESRIIAATAANATTSSPTRKRSQQSPTEESKRPRGAMYQKKQSAVSLQFNDSDDEDGRVKLSGLPPAAAAAAQNATAARGSPPSAAPSQGSPNSEGKNKRVRFSGDEVRAIRQGVRTFGVGKWKEIKEEYAIVLRNRTTIQIKDKYRTMVNRDEI